MSDSYKETIDQTALDRIEQLDKMLLEQVKKAKAERNFAEVKRLQKLRVKMKPDDLKAWSDLASIAKREGNFGDLRRIQEERVKREPWNYIARNDLVMLAKRRRDFKEIRRLQEEGIRINPNNSKAISDLIQIEKMKRPVDVSRLKKLEEMMEEAKRKVRMDEEEFGLQNQIKSGNSRISEVREKLYKGEVDIGQIKELAEEFEGTTEGTILIAEVCIYFDQKELAQKALKSYKRDNTDIPEAERKAINKALQIAQSKRGIKDPNKWNETYSSGNTNQDEEIERV